MRHDVAVSGVCGLAAAFVVYASAEWMSRRVSFFLGNGALALVILAILLLFAVLEIPVMIFAVRNLLHSPSTPLPLALGVNTAFVAFAAVYALAFVLITHEPVGGRVLAATSVLRFLSGVWIK